MTELMPIATEVVVDVWLLTNRGFRSNTWICRVDGGKCLVVDPGLDTEALETALRRLRLTPIAVLSTHGHFDHVAGAFSLKGVYGAPLFLHEADLPVLKKANFLMMICKVKGRITVPDVGVTVREGTELTFRGDIIRFMHVPGHTPGSCMIMFRNVCFTGDTLYSRSVGLVRLPGEDSHVLRQSLLRLWNIIPDEAIVCPGHAGFSRMGDVRTKNEQLRTFLSIPARGVAG